MSYRYTSTEIVANYTAHIDWIRFTGSVLCFCFAIRTDVIKIIIIIAGIIRGAVVDFIDLNHISLKTKMETIKYCCCLCFGEKKNLILPSHCKYRFWKSVTILFYLVRTETSLGTLILIHLSMQKMNE